LEFLRRISLFVFILRRLPISLRNMDYAAKPGFRGMSVARSPDDDKKDVWFKLQELKNAYLEDMIELYGMLTARSNQPMPAEQLQKLKHYKDVLHRMIPYLRVPQERVPKEFNIDKVEAFEKQIKNIMETFKRRRQGAA
jgi:PAX-interacting protein 1